MIPTSGPRSWVPDNNHLKSMVASSDKPHALAEPRVQAEFSPISYPTVRPPDPKHNGTISNFRRPMPITYPGGKIVLPQPSNLPIIPSPLSSETPKNFAKKLFHVRDKVGNKLNQEKLLQDPISSKI